MRRVARGGQQIAYCPNGHLERERGALSGVPPACCSNWASKQLTGEVRLGDVLRSSTSDGAPGGDCSPVHGRPPCGAAP